MPRTTGVDAAVSRLYLQKILTARVYDVAIETSLEPRRSLSKTSLQPSVFEA